MKILFIFTVLFSIQSIIHAQNDHSFVPDKVYKTFYKTHPDAVVNGWYRQGDYYRVVYREPGTAAYQQALVYNKDGNVVRTEAQIQTTDFPPAVVRYYETHYPDKARFEIWGSKTTDGTYVYYSDMDDNTLYFDKDGNFLRSEKKVSYVK